MTPFGLSLSKPVLSRVEGLRANVGKFVILFRENHPWSQSIAHAGTGSRGCDRA